jgi:hypothetical protein
MWSAYHKYQTGLTTSPFLLLLAAHFLSYSLKAWQQQYFVRMLILEKLSQQSL